ncbi:uncharacterized protein LOC113002993 [Solenopsis invicta]|uniref:uncharacterized protein LOC113002993 n=1 Tax=Solenopsis invicta TaxID=13686 RepID=UPI000E33E95B|nr:uncharacterized protein LOC113002993 [Solenopsis invicta]
MNTQWSVFYRTVHTQKCQKKWLIKNVESFMCWWPPRYSNTATLIANCVNPNYDLWNKYEVEVVKYCSSLESTRKNAADELQTTTRQMRNDLAEAKGSTFLINHIQQHPTKTVKSKKSTRVLQETKKNDCNQIQLCQKYHHIQTILDQLYKMVLAKLHLQN